VWPQLLDVFPGQEVVERSSMNSWDDPGFRKAIEATGRKNIILTGLWTEVCVTWPTLEMIAAATTFMWSRIVAAPRRRPLRRPPSRAWYRPAQRD